MFTPHKALLLFLLPLAAVSLSAQNDLYAPTKIAKMDAAAYLAPFPANGVVPLNVIAGDFATNAPAAIGKYSNQRITVIGRVSALSKGSGENKVLVVTMQDAGASLPAVKGDFLYGSIPQNSEMQVSSDGTQAFLIRRDRNGNILGQEPYLSVDQRVGIKGDFKEQKVSDIILTACKLVPKEKLRELNGGR
jgi:hypothetical protein